MALRHRLSDADTLASLSVRYFGEEFREVDIISYNNLVYPYISTEFEDRYKVFAHGYVYVKRATATTAVTIRKNWSFKTKPSIVTTVSKTYRVLNDVTLDVGELEAYIPVRATVPGLQGNTLEGTVSILGEEFQRSFITFDIVRNEEPIRGGTEGRVLTTGDYIYIPVDGADTTLDTSDAGYQQARYFYGEDLMLKDDDLVVAEIGDLATVSFADNVMQAVHQRLQAERGDNPSDYNWGTDIPTLIGNGEIPLEVLPMRIEIDIYESLSYEDRVGDPDIRSIEVYPELRSVVVDIDLKIVSLDEILEIRGLQIGGNT